jgi:hypothetical protein
MFPPSSSPFPLWRRTRGSSAQLAAPRWRTAATPALAHIAHDLATRDAAADLLPPVSLPELPPPELDAPREQIEDLAHRVRRRWGIPAGPIPNVVGLLESHGIVVLRLPLDTADVDAFSLPFHDRAVVVLATDKNDRARSRFDGAHELGHLVMHGEHVWGLKQVESQATPSPQRS